MTLEELGNLGEFIGAVAVVISLLYVAVEVRQNTRAVRSSTHQDMLGELHRFLASLTEHAEVAQLVSRASKDYSGLNSEEKIRFRALADRFLNLYEWAYLNYRMSTLDPGLWQAWDTGLRSWVDALAIRAYWAERKSAFQPEFQSYLTEEVLARNA